MEDLKIESISYARTFSILKDWVFLNDKTFKELSRKNANAKLFLETKVRSRSASVYKKNIEDLIKDVLIEFTNLCAQNKLALEEYSTLIVKCLTKNIDSHFSLNYNSNEVINDYCKIIKKYNYLVTKELNFLSNSSESEKFKKIIKKIELLQEKLTNDTRDFKTIIGYNFQNLKDKF